MPARRVMDTVDVLNTRYISDADSLERLCRRLRGSERLALDTEFVGEDRFLPRLELIQVATVDLCAVIDVPAVGALDSFLELLGDFRIEKVIHAGRQDLGIFYAQAGLVPAPIFDTQVAAAMVGYGMQVAYAQLVQRVLGTKLEKSSTLSNWSQRPLTSEQIVYALEDVQFLLPVYGHLRQRLELFGRLEWAREEFARLTAKPSEEMGNPRNRYQRIRGWDNLKPQSAAVLRELAAWREDEARRRNLPRGRVIRDEVLLELARRPSTTLATLRAIRGLHPSEVDRNGVVILEVVQRGLALPSFEWPEVPRTARREPEAAGQVELLQAVLKARADEEKIASGLLAGVADLQALVDAKQDRENLDIPILQGWRRHLAGEVLLRVLAGTLTVSVNPQTGKLCVSPPG